MEAEADQVNMGQNKSHQDQCVETVNSATQTDRVCLNSLRYSDQNNKILLFPIAGATIVYEFWWIIKVWTFIEFTLLFFKIGILHVE